MADAQITAKLSADASEYKSALADAAEFSGNIAGKISHHFTSATFIAKAAATGLGLHFTDIAAQLVEPFKQSAEAAKTIGDEAEKSTVAVEALVRAHQNDEQQLKVLQKEARHLREEIARPVEEKNSLATFLIALISPLAAALKIRKEYTETLEKEVKIAKAKTKLQELDLEFDKKKNAIKIDDLKLEENIFKWATDNRKELELEAKFKTGTILPAEMDELRVIRLQNKEKLVQLEITELLTKPIKQWTEAESARFRFLEQQTKEIEKQIDLIEHPLINSIKDATKETNSFVLSMGNLFNEISDVGMAWENFKISISTTGRGNKELSDAELKKKIATSRADIASRQIALNLQSGVTGSSPFDPLLAPQQSNLQQALNELQLRRDVRRNSSAFGQDRAFQMFGGTEQRFQQILSGMSPAETTRLANNLEKLNRHFDRGIPFVFSTSTGTPQVLAPPDNG